MLEENSRPFFLSEPMCHWQIVVTFQTKVAMVKKTGQIAFFTFYAHFWPAMGKNTPRGKIRKKNV